MKSEVGIYWFQIFFTPLNELAGNVYSHILLGWMVLEQQLAAISSAAASEIKHRIIDFCWFFPCKG
jgi:uncharacterized membrane protein YGL010W